MWSSGGYFRYFLPDKFPLTSNDLNTGVLFSYFYHFFVRAYLKILRHHQKCLLLGKYIGSLSSQASYHIFCLEQTRSSVYTVTLPHFYRENIVMQ